MIYRLLLMALLAVSISSCQSKQHLLKFMTYNIRLDVAADGENAWPNRKDFLLSQVLFLEPDILGVQEARPNQIEDLSTTLVAYDYIGEGRDGGKQGEHSAIYYNTQKLSVEQQRTFWLSTTPDQVSKGWDAAYPRICTYGLFTLRDSNKKFWVFNTHLDHLGAQAQQEGMHLILQKIAERNPQNYPVVLMGDFNVAPDSKVIATIEQTLTDAHTAAPLRFGPTGTFNGFQYHEPITRRIDYIFLSRSSTFTPTKYAVLSSAIDFRFPSDHFPVFVEVRW